MTLVIAVMIPVAVVVVVVVAMRIMLASDLTQMAVALMLLCF